MNKYLSTALLAALLGLLLPVLALGDGELARSFANPPEAARAWCYWWWLNGAASKEGITRDFQEMKKQGIAGALLFDAGEAGAEAPRGPHFMSTEWRELYKHAVSEADRLGIALGVNLCSGWNAGGPWITPEHAAKKLVFSETPVKGPGQVNQVLPKPKAVDGYYRDIAVLAHTASDGTAPKAEDISNTIDLTKFVDNDGRLAWDAPAGSWSILRIGYTLHGKQIQCVGSGPTGPEIDTMSAAAMDAHFAETGAKLIADAGSLAGKSLQYFHIDSWELGQPTWTPAMREEFQRRRGYDPLLYLPVLLKPAKDGPAVTRRFLADYRRTTADLVAANYYGRLRELTVKGGLRGIHPESGGPFFEHWIDALQCEGINDIPMGEFWKRNREPDGPIVHQGNPSLKQAASAAHIYGKPVCQAEAFTSFACDWIDDPWSMKDIGDAAFCEGLTRNVLCFWVHQSRLDAKPGFQWAHVGTHFDCNLTWWNMSDAWLTYLARCQHMLRQGLFVADFAYLKDEEIPGFIAVGRQEQPLRPAGFDYDVLNTQVLLGRAAAKDGRLVLPDGMSYRYLVLPHHTQQSMSPAILRKIKELAEGGVTVVGPRPESAPGLTGYPRCDQEVKALAGVLWGPENTTSGQRAAGSGRVLWGRSLDEIVRADALSPDIEFRNAPPQAKFDWIHRRSGTMDIYFLSNQTALPSSADVIFRVQGRQPEVWDAVTGRIRALPEWCEETRPAATRPSEAARTVVPMRFAPRQSFFVVFDRQASAPTPLPNSKPQTRNAGSRNFPPLNPVMEIPGPWQVSFDPKWGGPARAVFEKLDDWTGRPEEGIQHFSGTATYRQTFALPAAVDPQSAIHLDLGAVKNVARVKVNGQDCGVVWTAPWRAEITGAVRAGANDLEIEVANLWPNRLIGDAVLTKDKRFTTTNVRTYDTMASGTYGCPGCEARKKSGHPAALLSSGLLGPVMLQTEPPKPQ